MVGHPPRTDGCRSSDSLRVSPHMVETIEWTPQGVVMIDQTRLPLHEQYVTCRNYQEVATAIRDMIIRGAPAIGVAAAMGVAIGVQYASEADLDAQVDAICETLAKTRPTAVNLFWAIDRMKRLYATLRGQPLGEIRERLIQEAQLVREEDIAINRAIGRHGAALVPDHKTVLTLSLIHISEPTRLGMSSYAVFCLKKKKNR